jgi:hypothetical protein
LARTAPTNPQRTPPPTRALLLIVAMVLITGIAAATATPAGGLAIVGVLRAIRPIVAALTSHDGQPPGPVR